MQQELPCLYLLHDDPELRAALRSLCAATFRVKVVEGWSALGDELRRCTPTSVAVVDPYFASADVPAVQLRRLLAEFASSPVVAALRATPERIGDLRLVNEWGVADILDLGEELTAGSLANRFEAARYHRVRVVLKYALPRHLPARSRALITTAAEVVSNGGQTPELAKRLQLTERTLSRWSAKLGLPQPRRVLAWLRLLLAADMLREGNRSVAAVAKGCGYASDASLRNAFKMIAGTTPAEVKEKGAHATLLVLFTEELSKAREQDRPAVRTSRSYLN